MTQPTKLSHAKVEMIVRPRTGAERYELGFCELSAEQLDFYNSLSHDDLDRLYCSSELLQDCFGETSQDSLIDAIRDAYWRKLSHAKVGS